MPSVAIDQFDDHTLITGSPADRQAFRDVVAAARSLPAYAGALDIAAIRRGGEVFADGALALPVPAGFETEPLDVGGIPAQRYARSEDRNAQPLLYFHGGGFVAGSVTASRGIAATVSAAFAAPVYAVGYRQAPEHPYPAADEDALTAYDWLCRETGQPITLLGDSAGGSIAIGLALEVARTQRRPVRAAIASSPWFDLLMRGESWQTNRDRDIVSADLGRFFRDLYLGGADPEQALAPLRCDLDRAPPMLIQMGEAEGARDDAVEYARFARGQGAEVSLELYADMPHNFVKFDNPISRLAINRMARWWRSLPPS